MLGQEEVSINHPEIKAFRQRGVINTFTELERSGYSNLIIGWAEGMNQNELT